MRVGFYVARRTGEVVYAEEIGDGECTIKSINGMTKIPFVEERYYREIDSCGALARVKNLREKAEWIEGILNREKS